ncbi:MAG: hypothetical protein EOP49_09505 [Sphingobacteriales bacterium]|nr:MAG: hypothetical protein EOP49_09505 [Sphingobacteriales bacterium]
MMNRILVTVGMLALLGFSQCKKEENDNYTVAFYNETDSADVNLFINDVDKGDLPYIMAGADDCNDARALRLALEEGSHHLQVKDASGNVKADMNMELNADGEINTITGSHTYIQFNKCVTVGIGY